MMNDINFHFIIHFLHWMNYWFLISTVEGKTKSYFPIKKKNIQTFFHISNFSCYLTRKVSKNTLPTIWYTKKTAILHFIHKFFFSLDSDSFFLPVQMQKSKFCNQKWKSLLFFKANLVKHFFWYWNEWERKGEINYYFFSRWSFQCMFFGFDLIWFMMLMR